MQPKRSCPWVYPSGKNSSRVLPSFLGGGGPGGRVGVEVEGEEEKHVFPRGLGEV